MIQLNQYCAELDVQGGELNSLISSMKNNVDQLYIPTF